jgi:hypothetical protein
VKELESEEDDLQVDEMDKDLLELEKEGFDGISDEDIHGMGIKEVKNSNLFNKTRFKTLRLIKLLN